MRSEREKMLAGELYDPLDPELVAARARARDLCQTLNATREGETEVRRALLHELFGRGGDSVWMQPPFFCDYGTHIELGAGAATPATSRIPTATSGKSCGPRPQRQASSSDQAGFHATSHRWPSGSWK